MHRRRSPHLPVLAGILALSLPAVARSQSLRINEFCAINETTITDEDGDASDWIEVFHAGLGPVDLNGWYLTDDELNLQKWACPPIELSPGDYLLVFASGKDRSEPGLELHTNFRLSGSGDYLALVQGETIVHEFHPAYPEQLPDVSYGIAAEGIFTLIGEGATGDYWVPGDGSLDAVWTELGFAPPASWTRGTSAAIGYDVSTGGGSHPPPLSYWSLDGHLQDEVGPNHGAYSGAGEPSYVPGFDGAGTAMSFDGTEHVRISQNEGLPIYNQPAYSIAMWVKGGPQADDRVYSEGSSASNSPLFNIGTQSGGSTAQVDLFIRTDGSGTPHSHTLSQGNAFDNTWHHIAWVDVNGEADLYIDGLRDGTNFDYAKQPMSLNITSLGSVLRSTDCCNFTGALDEVAVWDLALTPEQIEDLAAGVSPAGGSAYARLIGTDVESAMRGANGSIYLRVPFTVENPDALTNLTLGMRYDDGFIAYLNGVEVASRQAPAVADWNASATGEHPFDDAREFEDIDISAHLGRLLPGENVLAIHGLNLAANDDDFLIAPRLVATASALDAPRYLDPPTPGSLNLGGAVAFVADTKFSLNRGFYETPIDVEISSTTPGAVIRYTVDQSWPSETHGEIYDGPIRIATTTTLRAMAFKAGHRPTNVDTHTYIFLDDVLRQAARPAGYPTTWQGFPADYAMDPEVTLNQNSRYYRPTLREDLKSLPSMSLVVDRDDLMGPVRGIYTHSLNRGEGWERPASLELIWPEESGEDDFELNCGVRMTGNSSARPGEGKHSFRVLFKSKYGPTKLRYRLMPDSPIDRFDTLVLRCFSTDSWHFKDGGARYRRWDSQFIRDLWMKDSHVDMGERGSYNTYVHLYVNGMYWGLYNPCDRPDDAHFAQLIGGEKEDWDIYKDGSRFKGSSTSWGQLMSLVNSGLGTREAYQRLQGNDPDGTPNPALPVLLDVDNIIDYMILHLYGCSEDWPHHNWMAARYRPGDFGGWRFQVWDQEITMDFVFRDRLNVSNTNSPAIVYSQLRANSEFRVRFGDRVHRHLFNGGALSVEEGRARWMRRANQIDRAVNAESARWGDYRMDVADPRNSPAELYNREDHWLVERDKVIEEYIPRSNTLALQRFERDKLYPAVDAPVFSQHGGLIDEGFLLRVSAPAEAIYYTVNGGDPRLEGGAISDEARAIGGSSETKTLLAEGATGRVLVPTDGTLESSWIEAGFSDAGWISGATGVGYDRATTYQSHLKTDLRASMDGVNATLYLRMSFEMATVDDIVSLALRMKYDDGFIAYLNGQRIASANAPADPQWNSRATASHSDTEAVNFQEFTVADPGILVLGTNILAIQGLNQTESSSDMLISPALVAVGPPVGGDDPRIPLNESSVVRARSLDGGEWSALTEATFLVDSGLRITEIMYHPIGPFGSFGEGDFEFIEIQNVLDRTARLDGVRLSGAVDFDFSVGAVSELPPGGIVVVVKNLAAFTLRYGVRPLVAGEFSGRLGNGGERIVLSGSFGESILDFEYSDLWLPPSDGEGLSMVIADYTKAPETWGLQESWQLSADIHGSPGEDETGNAGSGGLQRPGDANQDGALDIGDPVTLLLILFAGSPPPLPCSGAIDSPANRALLDANGDAITDASDVVHNLSYLFLGGSAHALGARCVRIEACPNACGR